MFWGTTDFCMKLLKAEWKVNQQEGGEEFKCYKIWQMMVDLLHSNGQLRTERDGDTEKGCQKPSVKQKTTDDDDDGENNVYKKTIS